MKKILIIRSANVNILKESIDFFNKRNCEINVLSDRNFDHSGIKNIYTALIVSNNSVDCSDKTVSDFKFEKIVILIDLKRYSLKSYKKFVTFCRTKWNSDIIFFSEGRQELYIKLLYDELINKIKRINFNNTCFKITGYLIYKMLIFLKPVKKIVFCHMRTDRIGHLAANNETFLRRKIREKDKTLYIGVKTSDAFIANYQLFKLFQRKWLIISSTFLINVINESVLKKSEFYINLHYTFKSTVECHDFDNTPVNFRWTKKEINKGRTLLEKMGIDSWFVCFHSRDGKYLKTIENSIDTSYHDFRDCDISNYFNAMEYIAASGGYAVRMGHIAEKILDTRGNSRIIDYAAKFRTDFMDMYLLANCKFFVGCTAGLFVAATVFDKPVVTCNHIPYAFCGLSGREIFIPKKLWKSKEKRFALFREIFSSDICNCVDMKKYLDSDFIPVENTKEEVLATVKEMNEYLDGKHIYSEEEKILQKKYREAFKMNSKYYYDFTATIGASFLEMNRNLL